MGSVILGTSEVEDLGILGDSGLNFSRHVEEQVSRANRTFGLIKVLPAPLMQIT